MSFLSFQSTDLKSLLDKIIKKEGQLAYEKKMKNTGSDEEFDKVNNKDFSNELAFLNIFNQDTFKVET